MNIVAILIACAIGAVLGLLLFAAYRKVDVAADNFQRRVNKLENMFAAAGSNWMAELLEAIVVGDEAQLYHKLKEMYEAPNTIEHFNINIAYPIFEYVLRSGDPSVLKKIANKYGWILEKTTAAVSDDSEQ